MLSPCEVILSFRSNIKDRKILEMELGRTEDDNPLLHLHVARGFLTAGCSDKAPAHQAVQKEAV